jgi:hypothetical protein
MADLQLGNVDLDTTSKILGAQRSCLEVVRGLSGTPMRIALALGTIWGVQLG